MKMMDSEGRLVMTDPDPFQMLYQNGIHIEGEAIRNLCVRYMIQELSVFGSSLRQDFNAESDVDILVSFNTEAKISLFDIIDLENELTRMLGRKVDLVEKESLRNPIRRQSILSSMGIIYAA